MPKDNRKKLVGQLILIRKVATGEVVGGIGHGREHYDNDRREWSPE